MRVCVCKRIKIPMEVEHQSSVSFACVAYDLWPDLLRYCHDPMTFVALQMVDKQTRSIAQAWCHRNLVGVTRQFMSTPFKLKILTTLDYTDHHQNPLYTAVNALTVATHPKHIHRGLPTVQEVTNAWTNQQMLASALNWGKITTECPGSCKSVTFLFYASVRQGISVDVSMRYEPDGQIEYCIEGSLREENPNEISRMAEGIYDTKGVLYFPWDENGGWWKYENTPDSCRPVKIVCRTLEVPRLIDKLIGNTRGIHEITTEFGTEAIELPKVPGMPSAKTLFEWTNYLGWEVEKKTAVSEWSSPETNYRVRWVPMDNYQ